MSKTRNNPPGFLKCAKPVAVSTTRAADAAPDPAPRTPDPHPGTRARQTATQLGLESTFPSSRAAETRRNHIMIRPDYSNCKRLPAPAGLAPVERRIGHYRPASNHSSPFFLLFRRRGKPNPPGQANPAAEKQKKRRNGVGGGSILVANPPLHRGKPGGGVYSLSD